MKSNLQKYKLSAISLLTLFLFSLLPQVNAFQSSSTERIVFALRENADVESLAGEYSMTEPALLFDQLGLPATYTASVDRANLVRMQMDSRFIYSEHNGKVSASQLFVSQLVTTNDPFFTTELTEDKQWYLSKIKMPEAWNYGKGSSSVKVAIIDTGIHASHLDLDDGRVVEGYNATTGQLIPANTNSDDNGHGTAVAGVIGAIPNNGKGVAGINWNISVMPIKALSANGTGDIAHVAAAIIWAADHGAQIINMSLGGPGFGSDQTLNNAIIYAHNKGSLIISAAGNDLSDQGINLDTNPVYPICSDGGANMVIGVAASDVNDRKASFSNFGINCIDITAPGKKILTTAYLPSDPSDNVLIYGSGTSLATPVVSGVAALLKSNNPALSNVQIRDIILKTADNIDNLNQNNCLGSSCNGFLGKGRINALSALSPQPILNESLVRELSTNKIYQVTGGAKRYVSDFVFTQRGFLQSSVITETHNQLANYSMGLALPPLDGTLIKAQTDPTVYYIHQGVKRPLTYLVFLSRNFSFANVKNLPDPDVNIVETGEWYWPPDATMVLIKGDPTVYVMDQSVARPVTYFVFTQRKLSFAKVINVTTDEFSHVPRPADTYWLAPVDTTLVKSQASPEVYVIEQGRKRAMSGEAFAARGYRFGNIRTLPEAEMAVIAPGIPILN